MPFFGDVCLVCRWLGDLPPVGLRDLMGLALEDFALIPGEPGDFGDFGDLGGLGELGEP